MMVSADIETEDVGCPNIDDTIAFSLLLSLTRSFVSRSTKLIPVTIIPLKSDAQADIALKGKERLKDRFQICNICDT